MDKGNTNDKKQIIEQIKNRLSLENLLQIYNVQTGESKNTYHCPFHDDKKPSFSIKDNFWTCFSGCGNGDQISFIQKIDKLSFEEALIKASGICNVEYEKKQGKVSLEDLKEKHLSYLSNRGIKSTTATLFGLKSKGDYILFPQKREDKITGYKGINFLTKRMFFNGNDKQSKLFPDYSFEDTRFLIFTAGEYDCMYLTQKIIESGLSKYKVVTNSTGEGNNPKDLDRLEAYPEIEKFMIFYDHDETGKKGAERLAIQLEKFGKTVEVYSFPKDKKPKYDVSDFFNEGNSLDDLFKIEKKVYKPDDLRSKINLSHYILDTIDGYDFTNPIDYQVDLDGIKKISFTMKGEEKVEEVSKLPILITRQAINTDEDVVNLEVVFKRDFVWKKLVVEREIVCDVKKILSLCNSGFPVHSVNAKKIVEYLSAFELANIPVMKKVYLTHNNGWKNVNEKEKKRIVFGLGKNILGIGEGENNISFSPDQGFERFTKALDTKGSLETWRNEIKPLMSNSKVAFSIYASLAAPLLSLVDCSSFLIHFWGDSSMGKTTVMEIASSVWGNPAKESGGLITSWNNTMVFVERLASFFNDMPMYLDDSQTADDKTVSKIMYMIGNSTGRGRGKKAGGVDSNKSWHTVCFSTGEKQLTESTQYDGAKARTIEFNGSPFGRNEGKIVNSIKSCVRENYGHIGKLFIEQLIRDFEDPEKLDEYKEAYVTFRDILIMKTSNEIGNRMAGYFAIIQLAGTLIEEYFNFGGDIQSIVEECFLEAIKERKSEGDTSTRALNEVVSYAQANIKKFIGKSDDSIKEHFGIWRESEYIAFFPHKLKEILTKGGFSYNSILSSWHKRGYLKTDSERNTLQVRFDGNRFRTVAINWNTINSIS